MNNTNWEKAIQERRSARSYELRPVEEEKMRQLKEFMDTLDLPFNHHVRIRLYKAETDKKLFTVFASPPDGMAFLAETDVCSQAAVGFAGEYLILFAESLGLATCWYGHYNLSELERIMPHLGRYASEPMPKWGYGKGQVKGERAICITPLGYWQKEGLRLFDRMTETLISYKRKPVEALLENSVEEKKLPDWLAYALDLARKAPSAANSQHWRFKLSQDFKTVTLAMPVGYRHIKWEHPNVDIGICACHFWLGLKLNKIDCSVSLYEEDGRAVFKFNIL